MKIDHINLVVADLGRSAAFYERVFGFERGFAATLQGAWIETLTGLEGVRADCLFLLPPGGGPRLELLRFWFPQGEVERGAPYDFGLRHLAFEVDDLDAALQRLIEAGAQPLSVPVEVPFRVADLGRKRLCYARDPDGILLEIAAYQ